MDAIQTRVSDLNCRHADLARKMEEGSISWGDCAFEEDCIEKEMADIQVICEKDEDEDPQCGDTNSITSIPAECAGCDMAPTHLILRNLPIGVAEKDIQALFVGNIDGVKIPIDRGTGTTRGFAFVVSHCGNPVVPTIGPMRRVAFEECNGGVRDGVERRNPPTSTIVIKNLPIGVTVADFLGLGWTNIDKITIPLTTAGATRGFAFVVFKTSAAAAAAFNCGCTIHGKKASCEWGRPRGGC